MAHPGDLPRIAEAVGLEVVHSSDVGDGAAILLDRNPALALTGASWAQLGRLSMSNAEPAAVAMLEAGCAQAVVEVTCTVSYHPFKQGQACELCWWAAGPDVQNTSLAWAL